MTRCAGHRGASSWPTATCSARRGSGPTARTSAASSTALDTDDMLGLQLAFDVTGDPAFPEKGAFEAARDLGLRVTTHAGVWGATNDDSIRLMWENGFMTPDVTYVHAATLYAGFLPAHRGERRFGVGVDRERAERRSGLPAHLVSCASTASRSRCPWTPAFGGARPVLGDAGHAVGRPFPRAPRGPRQRRHRRPQPPAGRRGRLVGRRSAGPRRSGSTTRSAASPPGKQADLVLIKNDDSPALYPLLHPFGSLVFPGEPRRRAHRARRMDACTSTSTSWSTSTCGPRRKR